RSTRPAERFLSRLIPARIHRTRTRPRADAGLAEALIVAASAKVSGRAPLTPLADRDQVFPPDVQADVRSVFLMVGVDVRFQPAAATFIETLVQHAKRTEAPNEGIP